MPNQPEVVCLADVPAEEWERYEELAAKLPPPPDTPVPEEELV